MAHAHTMAAAVVLGFVLPLAADSVERPVSFVTHGGDAWTFEKQIDATTWEGACDEVRFTTARGTVARRPHGTELNITIPLQSGFNRIVAECRNNGTRRGATARQEWLVQLHAAVQTPSHVGNTSEAPRWAKEAIVYGVIPSAYGGFRGVTRRLDEFTRLGVTALWLSPVTDAPGDDFGYAVTDHFRLRPALGTERDFRDLVTAAHARGLKIILDMVPNHVSEEHRYFADASAYGRASPYRSFFETAPAHYFDWEHLENLDYDSPEVRAMITEAFRHWVRDFGVDGFRVDVAWGPRQRAPDFWPRLRAALKSIKPDVLLLAEAPARDPYYFERGFDAAYDWTDDLGVWAWRDAFEDRTHTAAKLRDAIATSLTRDPNDLVFRFLNNNDTGARFVTRYGPETTRVAAAMLLTLPGLPGLYMGDETGAEFEPYDEALLRATEDKAGLRPWYARLIALRKQESALRGSALRSIPAPTNSLVYLRPGSGTGKDILVLLNYGSEPRQVTTPADLRSARWRDLLTGDELPPNRPLPLARYGVRILSRE